MAASILCVDDNLTLRQTLKHGLELYGFDVVTASGATEAIARYQALPGSFVTVLTDHDMPGMDGLGLVRALRDLGYRNQIIVMSGRMEVKELRAYEPYQIDGFFRKPFEISLLATLLRQRRA